MSDEAEELAYDPIAAGARVRELRDSQSWSQSELARRAKLQQLAVSNVERGQNVQARAQTFAAIAKALYVSTDYIFFGDDPDTPAETTHERIYDEEISILKMGIFACEQTMDPVSDDEKDKLAKAYEIEQRRSGSLDAGEVAGWFRGELRQIRNDDRGKPPAFTHERRVKPVDPDSDTPTLKRRKKG